MTYKVMLDRENIMFITTFRGEASIKSFIYFIVDKNWVIQELSTGAIAYLNLELKDIKNKETRLNTILPDIGSSEKGDLFYINKNNETYEETYYFRKDVSEIKFPKRTNDEEGDDDQLKEAENSGFKLVKLEKIDKSEAILS